MIDWVYRHKIAQENAAKYDEQGRNQKHISSPENPAKVYHSG